jgi:dephospho-CoA kinase
MFCAGLTGGIGSGKSTVAHIFTQCGASLIDADAISRTCTAANGAAIEAIAAAFGASFITAERALDRNAMRERMLSDPQAKSRLEHIIHPIVGREIAQQREQCLKQGSKLCIIDIPLLTEGAARWRSVLDAVWLVDCSEQLQRQRVAQRNGWPLVQINAVMAAQATRVQRRAIADLVLVNENTDLQPLRTEIAQIAAQFGL